MPIDFSGPCPLLQVFDMPTSIAFYCGVLGFEIESQSAPGPNFGWALLKRPGAELMLNTAYDDGERPDTPDPARIASHGDTCLYFACRDLDAAYQHLRANRVNADPPKVAYYGMKQLYFNDPDGFGLCLQWPASQAANDANELSQTATADPPPTAKTAAGD